MNVIEEDDITKGEEVKAKSPLGKPPTIHRTKKNTTIRSNQSIITLKISNENLENVAGVPSIEWGELSHLHTHNHELYWIASAGIWAVIIAN